MSTTFTPFWYTVFFPSAGTAFKNVLKSMFEDLCPSIQMAFDF